jgi:hypothetical protein
MLRNTVLYWTAEVDEGWQAFVNTAMNFYTRRGISWQAVVLAVSQEEELYLM